MNFPRILKIQLRKGFRTSANLLRAGLKMSGINMGIAERKNQFSGLEVAKMGNHISKNTLRGDIVGEAQKTIGTPLTDQTIKILTIPTIMKLTRKMTGW